MNPLTKCGAGGVYRPASPWSMTSAASIVWRVNTSRWVIRFLLAWRSIWQSPAR